MTPQFTNQITAGLLLLMLATVLMLATIVTLTIAGYINRRRVSAQKENSIAADEPGALPSQYHPNAFESPCRWVAIRTTNTAGVQTALHLHNATPCSWMEGISKLSDHNLFISPPISGWTLVIGQGLPDPCEDSDECFHFMRRLSRAFGHVQFFSSNRAVNHHAWVRAERGQVIRAYAWAGEVLWNQGAKSQAEIDLGMKCFDYWEGNESLLLASSNDSLYANSDKVIFLAASWSLDPTSIDESTLPAQQGIAGNLIHSNLY
jgi:hypothetical protein